MDFPPAYRKKNNSAAEEAKDEDGTVTLLNDRFRSVTIGTQAFYKQVYI